MPKVGKIAIMAASMVLSLQPAPVRAGAPSTLAAIPLYGSRTPGNPASEINDSALFGHPGLRNVTYPTLTPVLPAKGTANGAAAVVLPGGGFMGLSMEEEGWSVARALAARGISAFVLKYRLLPTPADAPAARKAMMGMLTSYVTDPTNPAGLKDPAATEDAIAALAMVRTDAAKWGVDPARVGMIGFSAGAMASLDTVLTATPGAGPVFVGYIYGPQARIAVPANAPPLFDALAFDDPLFGGGDFAITAAWREAKRPVELHVYQGGGHGFGLGQPGSTNMLMLGEFVTWLSMQGFLGAQGK
ncbi:MAG TPA: alpha/beta hydrolase [Sphingobium sp.]|uniref:alpha/beta hydrolase n=1 Tax=Sphingobium sp. TaxID=1912891 RepID=UPI002ED3571A